MKPPIEHIRLSNQAKEQLLRLKRDTGISNWNILCRWAFLLSLSDRSRPKSVDARADSNVEMSWKVFCGEFHTTLTSLFLMRCVHDKIASEPARATEFRKHLGRGIAMLYSFQKRSSIASLTDIAIK